MRARRRERRLGPPLSGVSLFGDRLPVTVSRGGVVHGSSDGKGSVGRRRRQGRLSDGLIGIDALDLYCPHSAATGNQATEASQPADATTS